MFALPRELHDEGVRRYGFHGLSYEYIASVLPQLDPVAAQGRTVVLHLGNGASMCALAAGRSVASTMGFTAVDGLPMGTRCGALDPGVILYLMDQRGMDARAIEKLIYNQSGPARRLGRVQRHAHAAGQRRAARRAGGGPVRLPHRARAGLAGRGAGRPGRASCSPAASARTAPRSARASAAARPGSAWSWTSRPTRRAGRASARRQPDRGVGDAHQRRTDDRAPHPTLCWPL